MKIIAYYALHYGREWLYWSMRALQDFVDEFVILYTAVPSYGHTTSFKCPESRQELINISAKFANVYWYDLSEQRHEGTHRDLAVSICCDRGATIILPIDHDEIWEGRHLRRVLDVVGATDAKDYRVSMQHYWRSVKWVCRDSLQPVRVIVPGGMGERYVEPGLGMMHHFGYAQSPLIVDYKWKIHGHQAELRSGWFENTFMDWSAAQLDVHPTNINFWNAAASDAAVLEPYIGDHPYFHLSSIDNSLVAELSSMRPIMPVAGDRTRFGS